MVVLLLAACGHGPDGSDSSGPPAPTDTGETGLPADSDETGESGETGETGETADTEVGTDADGDGYDVDEDCNDANPYVYPGAKEYCDAVDEDCDGDPLAPGVCSEPVLLQASFLALGEVSNDLFTLVPVRDLTGDGLADILSEGFTTPGAVYERSGLGTGTATPTIEFDASAAYISDIFDAGDVTGDGINDVVLVEQYNQEFVIFHGPLAPLEEFADADARWSFGYGFDTWCTIVEPLGDVNGDGAADLGCGTLEVTTPWTWFLLGGNGADAGIAELADGTGGLASLGDVDGDGIADVLSVGSEAMVIPGDILSDGASLSPGDLDVTWALPYGQGTDTNDTCASLGDLDADGYPEFYVSNYRDGADGAVYFYEGPLTDIASFEDAPGVLRGGNLDERESPGFGSTTVIHDDTTGNAVALEITDSGLYTAAIFPAEVPVGVVEASDWPHVTLDIIPGSKSGMSVGRAGVDVTGDGIGDYAAMNYDTNLLGILPGFVPPWGDPTYW